MCGIAGIVRRLDEPNLPSPEPMNDGPSGTWISAPDARGRGALPAHRPLGTVRAVHVDGVVVLFCTAHSVALGALRLLLAGRGPLLDRSPKRRRFTLRRSMRRLHNPHQKALSRSLPCAG